MRKRKYILLFVAMMSLSATDRAYAGAFKLPVGEILSVFFRSEARGLGRAEGKILATSEGKVMSSVEKEHVFDPAAEKASVKEGKQNSSSSSSSTIASTSGVSENYYRQNRTIYYPVGTMLSTKNQPEYCESHFFGVKRELCKNHLLKPSDYK